MSKLNIVRRCYNCNAILQDEDPSADGYISPEQFQKKGALVLFCNRCYQKQKYNFSDHEISCSEDYLSMPKDAAATDALIVFVVDLFSFETSFPMDLLRVIQGNRILVLANKRDLLPKNADDEILKEYVAHRFRVAKLKVAKEDVVLTSLNSLSKNPALAKEIDKRRERHDVYVVGAANAGKTLFIASYLRTYKNKTPRSVVTENYHGTSLPVLQIPLDSSSFIYDTPGTPNTNSVEAKLPLEVARLCYPDEPLRPKTHSLLPGDSLFLGGIARVVLLKGNRTAVSFFGSKNIKTLRMRAKNEEDVFLKLISKGDLTPCSTTLSSPSDFDVYDLEVEETGSRDIGIAGFGWIRFKGDKQTFRIFVPCGVSIFTSRSKIPFEKE